MNASKIAIFAFAAALMSFATATEVSARAIDEGATAQIGALAAQNAQPSLHGDRLALNPQPLPPIVEPGDEDGRW